MELATVYNSPIGTLVLESDGASITDVRFSDEDNSAMNEGASSDVAPILEQLRTWLDAYFAGKKPDPKNLPLAPSGTEFQKLVWQIIAEIPYGETTSYGAIAQEVAKRRGGKATSARAVGGATGRNPIGIVVPCHRVMGSDGSLTGYAGGIDRKIWLLKHEGAL